jgi:pilus assembly protein CpaE
VRQVLVVLRAMFDFVVADLGHSTDEARQEALELADRIVLVVGLDVPSVRLSRELLQRLEELGQPRDKLRLVANRYGQRKQFHWKKVQEALGMPIAHWIRDDPAAVNQALNQGQPLLHTARRASITRSFQKLAVSLNGVAR